MDNEKKSAVKDSGKERKSNMTLRNDVLVALWQSTDISASECARINLEDVDIKEHCISITDRNRERQVIRYNDDVAALLNEYIASENEKDGTDALFTTAKNNRLPYSNIHTILADTKKNSNISKRKSGNAKNDDDEFERIIEKLPPFCKSYFIGVAQRTTKLTRLSYARDLSVFFRFLKEEIEEFAGIEPEEFTVSMLDRVTPEAIEQFLFYVTDYVSTNAIGNDVDRYNDIQAKARKLSTLSSLYKYFLKKKQIEKNPTELVEKPKKREHAIIRLDPAEVANLLDAVESGEGQTDVQKMRNKPFILRDVCLLTLLLGTGIRVSECTGINIDDIDTSERAVRIMRKGQKQDIVYYGDEVEAALNNYIEERRNQKTLAGHENALFLSNQNRRISNRAVQILVKKYAGIVTPLKHITPHKLRSTFGTSLYQETGDIYLVATVLGHKDVNTTRKHYVAQAEEDKIKASKAVRLRTEKSDEND